MKNKTNIAMRCNQEQWELLKPKLENIFDIGSFVGNPYLTNNYRGVSGSISNTSSHNKLDHGREVHEEFNEKIFLEACGISVFEISKETVIKYQMKDEFPEVFGLRKDFTGWVKSIKEIDTDWLMYFEKGVQKYGIDSCKEWWECTTRIKEMLTGDEIEATTEEVTEALKNEAVKRGLVKGIYCVHETPAGDQKDPIVDYFYHERDNCLYGNVKGFGGTCVFKNGIWATVIPTKTVKEAEELLNCKIV